MHNRGLTRPAASGRQRTQGRLPVRLVAKLASRMRTHSAILENISKSGAKLALDNAPQVGSEVILQWHGNELFGRVTWTSPTQCGLVFDAIVPPGSNVNGADTGWEAASLRRSQRRRPRRPGRA